ncbi:MAG: hypothetical protein IKL53_05420 [Lachnospiraceae bacterium]|nr:hypothetical protein [Lachnospiraceae bacterium]
MNWTRTLKGLTIGLVTFCIGGSDFYGLNPLVVGFFIGVCLIGETTIYSYVGGILGLAISMPLADVV